jgi:hypothetical protein
MWFLLTHGTSARRAKKTVTGGKMTRRVFVVLQRHEENHGEG